MAFPFAHNPANPDPAFVLSLEEKLLGKRVSHWQKWVLWVSLPSFTTAALVASFFIHVHSTAAPVTYQENISQISQELHSVEQDNIGTLNTIEQQLDL